MSERAVIDWLDPNGRPEARLYSRWSPPAQQIPALADFIAAHPHPDACGLADYRAWVTEHAPHLITAVTAPTAPEPAAAIAYRYTVQTNPLRIVAQTYRHERWETSTTTGSPGELFAAAAQLLAAQALRVRALTEAFPRPPYAAHLASPHALEAAAVRHEANAAAAGWWPDEHPDHAPLDPTHSEQ
ncbi:hypothetical protein [Streptomyces sp. NBC_01244]|uniref:hypothetical protein n=1 Tax=Streptomyces sp. NBC_01244 TaxID=2903797 RepID=UPI002E12CA4E|nr:hypothetical protein OG247_44130 [Streptomyces sp. NBC_01244]